MFDINKLTYVDFFCASCNDINRMPWWIGNHLVTSTGQIEGCIDDFLRALLAFEGEDPVLLLNDTHDELIEKTNVPPELTFVREDDGSDFNEEEELKVMAQLEALRDYVKERIGEMNDHRPMQ